MFFLAIRQLLARPRQTILALLGITLGTAAFLTISGVMLGFRQLFINQLINSTAHVSVTARDEPVNEALLNSVFYPNTLIKWVLPPSGRNESPHLEYPQGWFDRFREDRDVQAYAPELVAQVLLVRTKISRSIRLIGVNAAQQMQATDIQDDMTDGNFSDLSNGGFQIILGSGLAEKLGVLRSGTVNVVNLKGTSLPAKVAGFFQTGIEEIDEGTAYAPLHYVQQINQTPGEISQILVKLKNPVQAEAKAANWSALSRDKVQGWDQANANFTRIFKVQDIVRYTLIVIILVVAVFGIYNILNMMVMQKRGEIAILRSMGYDQGDITRLFLLQGLALGLLGALGGMTLGTLVCLYLQTIEVGTAGIIKVSHILIAWRFSNYLYGFTMAFFSGILAAYFPARTASRMHPIDMLRSEGG